MDSRLVSDICSGLKLQCPTMLASGILGISLDVFNRMYRSGSVGAVVTKSLSKEPWEGYHNPVLFSVKGGGWINAVGLSNPGAKRFADMIRPNEDIPIIVSLVGSTPEDFETMIGQFRDCKVAAYEINLSCPHVAKVGLEVGDDLELVGKIISAVKNAAMSTSMISAARNDTDASTGIAGVSPSVDTVVHTAGMPVIAKVGLGTIDYLKTVGAAIDAGADAITAINTVRAMAIDVEAQRPILSNKIGGLSGTPIKPIALRCVYEISSKYDVPVIGCGGITTWQDAVEFILAGASAIQIGSAVNNNDGNKSGHHIKDGHTNSDNYDGRNNNDWAGVFKEINDGILQYMKRKGIDSIQEMSGLAKGS